MAHPTPPKAGPSFDDDPQPQSLPLNEKSDVIVVSMPVEPMLTPIPASVTTTPIPMNTPTPSFSDSPNDGPSSARPSGIASRVPAAIRASLSPPPPRAPAPSAPSILHPRGRIWPLLPKSAPIWQRFLRGVVRLVQGLWVHNDIFHQAPAMAFHFFLSLLPLFVFIGYVLGLVAQRRGAAELFGLLLHNLPPTTEAVLQKELGGLAEADRLGPLAAVGFLWIASGGTQGLMQAIEKVVGVPPRAWWRQRLLAVVWVVGTLIVFGLASFSIIQWEAVLNAPALSPLSQATFVRTERFIPMGFTLIVAIAALAGFYRFAVAHKHRVRRRVLPGACLAIGLVIVISWGFSIYLRTLATYAVYYGSLAAVAVLLIWLWLMSIAILVGAELNSQLEGLRDLMADSDVRD